MSSLGSGKTSREVFAETRKEQSRQARARYEADPKRCKFCGEKLAFEQRFNTFCSQSCSASFNNQGVTRHIKGTKVCTCGNPKFPQNKYCSECAQNHLYHRPSSLEEIKSEKARRRFLIEQRGVRCEGCGLDEWRGYPIPLEVHHIDGDTDNNIDANLQLLCPNCPALTDTHKRRNKNGKRQIVRRTRYANGQTW